MRRAARLVTLSLLVLAGSAIPLQSQGFLAGDVDAGSQDNVARIRVVNVGNGVAEGVTAALRDSPEGMRLISVQPQHFDFIEPRAAVEFLVTFSIESGAPPGTLEPLEIDLTAAVGELDTTLASIQVTVLERPRRTVSCNEWVRDDGDFSDALLLDIGDFSGTAYLLWNMEQGDDQIRVFAEDRLLQDTGCVGGQSEIELEIPPGSGQLRLEVDPSCGGVTNQDWAFLLECPQVGGDVFILTEIFGPTPDPLEPEGLDSGVEYEAGQTGFVRRSRDFVRFGTSDRVDSYSVEAFPERITLGEAFRFASRRRGRLDQAAWLPSTGACLDRGSSTIAYELLVNLVRCSEESSSSGNCGRVEDLIRARGRIDNGPTAVYCDETSIVGTVGSGNLESPIYGGVTKDVEVALEFVFNPLSARIPSLETAAVSFEYEAIATEMSGGETTVSEGGIGGRAAADLLPFYFRSTDDSLIFQIRAGFDRELSLVYEREAPPVVAERFVDPPDFSRPPVDPGPPETEEETTVADAGDGARDDESANTGEGGLGTASDSETADAASGGAEQAGDAENPDGARITPPRDRFTDTFEGPPDAPGDDLGDSGTTAPRVIGMTLPEARSQLERSGLQIDPGIRVAQATSAAESERVVAQSIEPGSRVEGGTGVVLTVAGPWVDTRTVPDLIGLTIAEARSRLQTSGIRQASPPTIVASTSPQLEGRVVEQSLLPGSSVAEGAEIALTIGGPMVSLRTVPDVVGLGLGEARRRVDQAGLAPQIQVVTAHSAAEAERVTAQSLPPGSHVSAGTSLVISLAGPYSEPVTEVDPPPTLPPADRVVPPVVPSVSATTGKWRRDRHGLASTPPDVRWNGGNHLEQLYHSHEFGLAGRLRYWLGDRMIKDIDWSVDLRPPPEVVVEGQTLEVQLNGSVTSRAGPFAEGWSITGLVTGFLNGRDRSLASTRLNLSINQQQKTSTLRFELNDRTPDSFVVRIYMGSQGPDRSDAWVWWEYNRDSGTAAPDGTSTAETATTQTTPNSSELTCHPWQYPTEWTLLNGETTMMCECRYGRGIESRACLPPSPPGHRGCPPGTQRQRDSSGLGMGCECLYGSENGLCKERP